MNKTGVTIDDFRGYSFEVELFGPRLGRVLEDVYLTPLVPGTVPCPIRTGDIVRLSHDPGENNTTPTLVEIVYKAGPRFLSKIGCYTDEQMYRIIALAAVLGAEVQTVTTKREPYRINICLLHAEEIDFPRIAHAAGLTRVGANLNSPPIHLCKIPFFSDDQKLRMIALAVVLGAEVMYVAEDPDSVVLFHSDEIDIRVVADAAGVTRNPEEVEMDLHRVRPRPGAVPGSEWESGTWGGLDLGSQELADKPGQEKPANDNPAPSQ